MLTFLSRTRCLGPLVPQSPATLAALALALALLPGALLAGGLRPAMAAQNPPPEDAKAPRPADLVILQERISREGPQSLGVYGIKADPLMPDNWRVQIWQEQLDRVTIATDKIRCSPSGPMRVTGTATRLIVRELNPGGPITSANRVDHLIWWAVCVPAQAGKDPATLGALARSLGYSGQLIEREEVLVAPRR
jgi:hypothetical protein